MVNTKSFKPAWLDSALLKSAPVGCPATPGNVMQVPEAFVTQPKDKSEISISHFPAPLSPPQPNCSDLILAFKASSAWKPSLKNLGFGLNQSL